MQGGMFSACQGNPSDVGRILLGEMGRGDRPYGSGVGASVRVHEAKEESETNEHWDSVLDRS